MVHLLQINKKFNINGTEWTLRCEKRVTKNSNTPYLKVIFGCETTKCVYSIDSGHNGQLYVHHQAYTTITHCKNIREAKLLVLQQLLK